MPSSGGALSYLTVEGPRPASYTPPLIDFSPIGNLVDDYQKGQQYGYQRNLQTMFRPGTPGGDALARCDTGQLFQLLAQQGGAPVVQGLLPQMLGAQSSQQIMQGIGGGQQSALPTGGADPRGMMPTVLDAAQQNNIDPRRLAAVARGEGLADYHGDYENGKPTSFGALQLHYGGRTKGLGDDYFAETGKDPRDAKNEKDMIYWAARKLHDTGWTPWTAARKLGFGKWDGIGQQTAGASPAQAGQQAPTQTAGPGLNQTNAAAVKGMYPDWNPAGTAPVGTSPVADAEAAPAVEQPPGATPNKPPFMAGGIQPSTTPSNNVQTGPSGITLAQQQPAQTAPGMEPQRAQMLRDKQQKLQRASEAAAANPYSPKGFSERIQRDADTAGEQAKQIEDFNAERSKQQYGVGIAGETKAVGAVGEARGKRVAEVIEAGGKPARDTLNDLNAIQDAVRQGGDNIKYGPGAEFWLKAKQVLNNIYPQQGLAEADTIVKMNARLAAAAAKSMTARPSQLEFKTFVANNPGIMNSKAGTIALLDILKQSTQQQINLGREAMRASPDQWQDIEDNFYQKNPLISPFTGQPLGQQQTAPQSPAGGAPVRISSPAERNMLAPGTRYVAPDGSVRTKQ